MRQLVGARVELAIGQALVLEHHRDGVGAAADLRLEQLRQRGGRHRTRGVVPLPQDGVALRRRTECRGCRSPAPAPQPPPPAAAPAAPPAPQRSPRSNRSVAYSSTPVDPAGVPSAPRCSPRLERQVELGAARWRPAQRSASARAAPSSAGALFCSASITWNSGWRDSERAGLSTSTSRSNGRSWWL